MSGMRLRLNRMWILAGLLIAASPGAEASEEGFGYFKDPEIDYWKKNSDKKEVPKSVAHVKPNNLQQTSPASNAGKTFQWEKYLNPAHEEFFKEGDYIPPAPFMEIARNPSDDNIEKWFKYIETKNELLRNLQTRLTEFSRKNPKHVAELPAPYSGGLSQDPEALSKVAARLEKPSVVPADTKRFRLRLYFDSHCPHCEKMMGTMAELAKKGYAVELRQIDQDHSIRARLPFPVADASREELKNYDIQAVPILLIGDLKKKSFFKMQGYQATSAVVRALSK